MAMGYYCCKYFLILPVWTAIDWLPIRLQYEINAYICRNFMFNFRHKTMAEKYCLVCWEEGVPNSSVDFQISMKNHVQN